VQAEAPKKKPPEQILRENVGVIQVALERFAMDHGGTYPLFLTGGDADLNLLTSLESIRNKTLDETAYPVSPLVIQRLLWSRAEDGKGDFKSFPKLLNVGWCAVFTGNPMLSETKGAAGLHCPDVLLSKGYLAQYPENPFASKEDAKLWGPESPLKMPSGGRSGRRMFDAGLAWGEAPLRPIQFEEPANSGEPRADKHIKTVSLAGNFFYHPLFCEGLTVNDHPRAILGQEPFKAHTVGHDVCGYVLVGFGPDNGMDFTDNLPQEPPMNCATPQLLKTSLKSAAVTGYLLYEPDPYPCKLAGEEVRDGGSGPDGAPDGAQVIVFSGLDRPPKTISRGPPKSSEE
jgi:hypothetical protein